MDEKMLTDDVFVADPVEERLMLGNEAVAQGAWEAGLRVVASYPGTPSTEITECVARFPEVDCQWAPNEKVATEVAFGAAMAGARAMTCMKHVGVNVAADPIFTAAYTGVNAGLVVVCADDPAMHSSPERAGQPATMPARPTSPCWSRRTAASAMPSPVWLSP